MSSPMEIMMQKMIDNQDSFKNDMSEMKKSTDQANNAVAQLAVSMDQLTRRQNKADASLQSMDAQMKELMTAMSQQQAKILVMEEKLEKGTESEGFVEPKIKKSKIVPDSHWIGTPRANAPGQSSASGNVPPTFTRDIDAYNPNKVIAKGFPRDMSSIVLEKHGEELLKCMVSSTIGAAATIHATRLKKFYSIEFADKLHAQAFIDKAKADGVSWTDPRSGDIVPLKAQRDQSVSQQITNHTLYHLYGFVQKYLKDTGKYDAEKMKLGSTGIPRELFLETDMNDIYTFYTISITDSKVARILPDYENLDTFGITKEMADLILEEASKAASSRRQ